MKKFFLFFCVVALVSGCSEGIVENIGGIVGQKQEPDGTIIFYLDSDGDGYPNTVKKNIVS